jgi:hypothetical protein
MKRAALLDRDGVIKSTSGISSTLASTTSLGEIPRRFGELAELFNDCHLIDLGNDSNQ